jgi:alkylation response protein AidB-like acyl-CoA dehydrogenase
MDFDFTEDQTSLRDAVRRWVDKAFAFSRRHAIAKAGGHVREVHGELADLGLTGLAIPEAHGGLGFGPVEAMVVCEELGRGLVHVPYAEAALMAPALLVGGAQDLAAHWLPRMASGQALVVPAMQERGARYRLHHVGATASERDGVWYLTGAKTAVAAADEADAYVVSARLRGGPDDREGIGLFLVERAAAQVRGWPTQDGARGGELLLALTPAALLLRDGLPALEHAVDVALAAQMAEAVGLMDALVALTVDYMNTRRQFGVPIASFQALRHRIADVKMQLELARSMSYYATLKLGEPEAVRRRAVSQARVQLGRSMRFVGQQCIQLHGGIGCTDEYAASHFFKRLTVLEMTYGDTLHHLGEVSSRMQDTAGVFA